MYEVPKAITAFRAAIELAPASAEPYAGLARACCAQAHLRIALPSEAYARAKAAALRALALDPACGDAQVALGTVLFFSEWDWVGAERSFERALVLDPNHVEAYVLYGQLLEALGKLDDGLEIKRRALQRDSSSPFVCLSISVSYWHQRRYDEAIEWANKTLAINPAHPHAREHLAGAYLKKGDADAWLAENVKHAESHGVPAAALDPLKQAYAAGGRRGVLKLFLERAAGQPQSMPAMQLAVMYAEAGDVNTAFHHLERAIESRDPALVHLAVAPQWDSLRADPRFPQCLARVGLSPVPQSPS
jgi:tetratricopeptide (TPR) repeat protein